MNCSNASTKMSPWPQNFMFILFFSPEVKDASERSGLVLEFAAFLRRSPDRAKLCGLTRARFSIGWFNAGVEWSITALTSHLIPPPPLLCSGSKRNKRMLYLWWFFSFLLRCYWGNSRTSAVFSLLLLLRDSAKKYLLKLSPI